MLIKRNLSFAVLLLLGLWISSCENLTEVSKMKDGTNSTIGDSTATLPAANKGVANQTINNWIFENMNVYYLWGDKMATKTATNMQLSPDKYFESLLYQYGTVDRFSWIEEDAEALVASLQGVTKAAGITYSTLEASPGSSALVFAIRYTIKDSPADKAGLKRGDIITKVNGVEISKDNYQSMMIPEALVLTLGEITSAGVVSTSKTVSVNKAVIQNYPVHFSSVIDLGIKKVGYIVYNQFVPGITSNGSTNTRFDDELRSIFADFKTKGVNELVLDLRYNGGGYISSSDVLSSLIVKNLKPGTLMNKQVWSANARKLFNVAESEYETNWINESSNLGSLDRVFILTSRGTASASELVINNLKPFMDVVLIGNNTYGKDVGSVTIDDSRNKYRWKWGLQPIVLRTVNALGEANYGTVDGFTPTYKVNDNVIPFHPFGDPNETLLKVALEKIGGSSVVAKARLGSTMVLPLLEKGGGFDNMRNNITDMYLDKIPQ